MFALKKGSSLVQRPLVSLNRGFLTTPVTSSILDYFKFYNKKKPQLPKERATEDVIKDVEQHKEVEDIHKVKIIGRRDPRQFNKKLILKNLKGFTASSWIPAESKYAKALDKEIQTTKKEDVDLYPNVISKLLGDIQSQTLKDGDSTTELNDLTQRFGIVKQVQLVFGIYIPDLQLTTLSNFDMIEKYLLKELNPDKVPVDELIPDKINWDPAEFEGTNISVGKYVFGGQKSKTLKKLLRKANKLERGSFEDSQQAKSTETTSA